MSHRTTVWGEKKKNETREAKVWLLLQAEMSALNEQFRPESALSKSKEHRQAARQQTPAANHI